MLLQENASKNCFFHFWSIWKIISGLMSEAKLFSNAVALVKFLFWQSFINHAFLGAFVRIMGLRNLLKHQLKMHSAKKKSVHKSKQKGNFTHIQLWSQLLQQLEPGCCSWGRPWEGWSWVYKPWKLCHPHRWRSCHGGCGCRAATLLQRLGG